ncbi:porin family protein [Flavobacterium sp. 5]|uniref:porin family protein n=1 Tax=Flavobacterium sp. 5 TaxID=2035199 RepID=UPI000C2C2AF3|nr:porin family protein [Flavobacterium sp. 5]PKB16367.1 outer membrane protein with beta-barrel domain [Flavobacterium sp. 5]
MMRLFLGCFLFLSIFKGFSQETTFSIDSLHVKIDSLYREDQFYAGLNYNSIVKKPEGLAQDKISFGFGAGFLRDFPLNKSRTFAIAPGIGFSFNNYIQNLAIIGSSDNPIYGIIPSNVSYDRNRFEQLRVEIPIEFRWRNSTPETFQFFRLYGGFKVSYLLYDKSVFDDGNQKIVIKNNKDFEELLYGVYLSMGYSAFNLQIYYGLNSIFKSTAKIDSVPVTMNVLSLGVIFYIL